MPISIGSNISSLLAQRQLNRATSAESLSFERLASGMRINRASDDAAGLSVSSQLNVSSRIFSQAIRNANDGISALSIAEGALTSGSGILLRLRELAIGASNGSFSRTQRISSDKEAAALTEEYNRIFSSVTYNGINLLDGDLRELRLQLGLGTSGSIGFGLGTELDRTAGNGTFVSSNLGGANFVNSQVEADFNGDGIMDVVTSELGNIVTYFGNSNGTFTSQAQGSTAASAQVVIGDFNGDGRIDIAAQDVTSVSVVIYTNLGTGSFGTSAVGGFSGISSLAAADLNNDGRTDLLVGASGAHTVHLASASGSFSSTPTQTISGTGGSAALLGDLDGNGSIDILTGLKSYFGSGNGTFGSGIASGLTSSRQLADFNRDGILDSIGTSGSNALVNLGRGDGTFADAASIAFGGFIYTLKVADLNADGVSDILVNANGTMQGRYGSADGTFGASNTFGTVVLPFASNLSIGDFNGDGTADYLVSTNASSGFRIGLANSEQVTSMQRLNLTTRAEALGSLSVIDATLARVSKELGAIGSTQSRLAVALNTLSSSKENYDAASARITNIDIANESAALVQTRTLKEIATAILAQANQAPALALQLLE